jgi:hypothetical protein
MNDTELYAYFTEVKKDMDKRFEDFENKIRSIMTKVNKIERDLDYHKNCIGNHPN